MKNTTFIEISGDVAYIFWVRENLKIIKFRG